MGKEARLNGIAIQIGLAEKFYWDCAGSGLALTRFGYTVSVGSPAQKRDLEPYPQVREDARRFGVPLIVWAHPRGEACRHEFSVRNIWQREPGESLRFAAQL